MALKTSEEYVERLSRMRPNVYAHGKKIRRDDPMLEIAINTLRVTFDSVNDPDLKDLIVTSSHLTGEPINRFTALNLSTEDLYKQQEMKRVCCHRVGGCAQRCMATDTLNAIGVVTKDIDDAKATNYHDNFLEFVKYYQANDLVGSTSMTDPKGDRKARPSQQEDPDLYLRVVEKNSKGIVVRGAKNHITMGPYVDEHLVIPTRTFTTDEGDWAVSFAIPADTEGVKIISRIVTPRPRIELKAPYNQYGVADSVVVFENVFVPWARVFMCGEWEFAGRLALTFAGFHRHSYCGCKPAITDIILGATALVAEYNGVGSSPHIVDELTELMVIAEIVFASGIAAATRATKSSSGIYTPEFLYSNTGRYMAGMNIYHEYDILNSIAGGLPSTIPPEEDWLNPETGPDLAKYISRKPGISAENLHRLYRFISDFSCSAMAGWSQYAGVHGGGSPIMEKIGIRSGYDLESKKNIAKYLAGIED
ncbi:MAG: aromatic ring hydroxylase [Desulfobacteraceae bacterium]|uniref:Aromatic ring hydroxylase n=1 Tax=Candidatus Desulfacyla euxinica TaxID=2841693 RepID=A0A8J6T7C2_9DELT|nr:aromatic ring hydroxylase [Candidatus Desulfacyla euxinica]MBL6978125.1 aromatic ring hydroxylase [Desulfobacteraceae bacterium]MBL7216961.1 aromatic ring hydroxylase [Desulfobacteraceae bacterium]